jgi:hypothetical protein
MCEGLSKLSGPIPPHPSFLSEYNGFNSARSDNSMCEGIFLSNDKINLI